MLKRQLVVVLVGAAVLALAGAARVSRWSHSAPTLHTSAIIGNQGFVLEIAADRAAQDKGLGGRASIDDNAGMLFIFSDPEDQVFVMRDCDVPLDLLYLDDAGRITAIHHMQPESPRTAAERSGPDGDASYLARLKGYPSPGPVRFAIELPAGAIQRTGVKEGDRVQINSACVEAVASR